MEIALTNLEKRWVYDLVRKVRSVSRAKNRHVKASELGIASGETSGEMSDVRLQGVPSLYCLHDRFNPIQTCKKRLHDTNIERLSHHPQVPFAGPKYPTSGKLNQLTPSQSAVF